MTQSNSFRAQPYCSQCWEEKGKPHGKEGPCHNPIYYVFAEKDVLVERAARQKEIEELKLKAHGIGFEVGAQAWKEKAEIAEKKLGEYEDYSEELTAIVKDWASAFPKPKDGRCSCNTCRITEGLAEARQKAEKAEEEIAGLKKANENQVRITIENFNRAMKAEERLKLSTDSAFEIGKKLEKAEGRQRELEEGIREALLNAIFFHACKEQDELCKGCKEDKHALYDGLSALVYEKKE
jgi:hypothetical protein